MAGPCPHSLPVRDAWNGKARQVGLDPMPHGDRCTACHGVFTGPEMEARARWLLGLLSAIRARKKGALYEKEEALWRALTQRFGGVA